VNGRRHAAKLSRHEVVTIPGDGIGPEVTDAVQRILDAARAPIAWVECRAGLHAIDRGQNALPQETLDTIRKHQVALKGPCTTPIGEGFA
jgi:isocitrate dehydrogenase